ncbi:Sec62/63 complex, subunit Sec66 [Syncephalastrum racemosum]|uniref:Sec62/63 complex, subunit Sec66 n=1 Tax=Syncephalastrum racemosum TaxID=13706 RepID=A0A1X2HRM5_SYNRA|nr:Sec62/63 complex, subunit Sec66 [Syncephalastrum racemosum]
MTSLLLPTVYLGGCIAAMSAFSFVYRRVTGVKSVEPWFGYNEEKEQYIALLNSETPVPEHHLRAALLRRSMEAVRRLVHVQQEKPALQQLMRMGSIGDDLWQDFTIAEQETMMELQDIVQEANTYKAGWGQTIFSSAAQMLEHEKQKKLATEMKELKEHEEKQRVQRLKREEEEEARESQRKAKEAKKAEEDLLREEEQASKSKKGKSKK